MTCRALYCLLRIFMRYLWPHTSTRPSTILLINIYGSRIPLRCHRGDHDGENHLRDLLYYFDRSFTACDTWAILFTVYIVHSQLCGVTAAKVVHNSLDVCCLWRTKFGFIIVQTFTRACDLWWKPILLDIVRFTSVCDAWRERSVEIVQYIPSCKNDLLIQKYFHVNVPNLFATPKTFSKKNFSGPPPLRHTKDP